MGARDADRQIAVERGAGRHPSFRRPAPRSAVGAACGTRASERYRRAGDGQTGRRRGPSWTRSGRDPCKQAAPPPGRHEGQQWRVPRTRGGADSDHGGIVALSTADYTPACISCTLVWRLFINLPKAGSTIVSCPFQFKDLSSRAPARLGRVAPVFRPPMVSPMPTSGALAGPPSRPNGPLPTAALLGGPTSATGETHRV